MTAYSPEAIVALIGNIGNRPDIREVQEKQLDAIREIVKERDEFAADRLNWKKLANERCGEINEAYHKLRKINAQLTDALQACARYFDAQDCLNMCDEPLCRKSAVYLTEKALSDEQVST